MKLYDIIEQLNTPQRAMLQSPLWDSETFCNVAQEYFENREYIRECETEAETITRFLKSYTTWLGLFSDNLDKVASALAEEYAPLENYSEHRESERTNTGTVADVGNATNEGSNKQTDNRTQGTTQSGTTTNTGTVKNDTFVYGGNGSSAIPDGKNEQTNNLTETFNGGGSVTNTGTTLNEIETETNTTNTRTDNLKEVLKSYVHGNMSMRSTQDFLLQELEVRHMAFVFDFISLFVNSCTIWG